MRRFLWIFALAAASSLLLPVRVEARDPRPPQEKAFSGSIERIEQHRCEECNCVELTALLKTDAGKFHVKLGPKSMFESHDFALSRGDIVEVKGIVIKEKENGPPTLLANEIRKGGETLILRGKYGRPMWLDKHGHTCPKCEI